MQNLLTGSYFAKFPEQFRQIPSHIAYKNYLKLRRTLLQAKSRKIVLSSDHQVQYLEAGDPNAPTVLFLHGFADSKDSFYDSAQILVRDYHLIIPDLPGFGESSRYSDTFYDLVSFATIMLDFCNELGLSNVHLVGNSLGGAVAAKMAIMQETVLSSLCLINPGGIYLETPRNLHHELFEDHNVFDVRNYEDFCYFFNRVFAYEPFIPQVIKDYFYFTMRKNTAWHRKLLADLFTGMRSENDPNLYKRALNNELSEISKPCFVVWGDEDTFFPKETAYLIRDKIKHAELYIMMDVGHIPQIEAPTEFCRVYSRFIRKSLRRNSA